MAFFLSKLDPLILFKNDCNVEYIANKEDDIRDHHGPDDGSSSLRP